MSGENTSKKTGEPIRLVVGLGNPGKEYQNTRHNVGFDIVDFLADRSGSFWSKEKKWQAHVARIGDVFLMKPQTYMNLSGRAVAALCRFHKLTTEQILVVYDDLDLGPGRLRLRATGSAAGHNGIKSIIQSLGTQNFARLKFGIGRAVDPSDSLGKGGVAGELSNYVLGKFNAAETEELQKRVARAADAVNCALSQGLTAAMNAYNEQAKKKAKQVRKPADPQIKPDTEIENLAKEKGTSES